MQTLPDRLTDDISVAPPIPKGVPKEAEKALLTALKANNIKVDAILEAQTDNGVITGKGLDGDTIFDFEIDKGNGTIKKSTSPENSTSATMSDKMQLIKILNVQYRDGVDSIESYKKSATGATGIFRDGDRLFNFSISEKEISYKRVR